MAQYKLTGVNSTEEAILNKDWPSSHEPAKDWRRFRIEYDNAMGFSNIEGTLYFPPGVEPFPILNFLERELQRGVKA